VTEAIKLGKFVLKEWTTEVKSTQELNWLWAEEEKRREALGARMGGPKYLLRDSEKDV
jgi:hypothetical protein